MAPVKPMLDGVELPQAQRIAAEDETVLAQHAVPALEGDFLQDQGRRATRIALAGVMAGATAGDDLKGLREKFRAAEPVPFVSDIGTATSLDQVLIEELGVRELAGRPARFEYALALREFIPPPAVATEPPPVVPPPPVLDETGTLVVEVIVTGRPDFDFSLVRVTVEGTDDTGAAVSRTLTNRSGNVWTEASFPSGSYTARAVVDEPQMSGSAAAAVRPGQTTQVTITLTPGALIAHAFVVHYWFDKAFVEPCLREVLRRVAAYSDAHPDEKLVIVGHTDLVGSDDYNQSLSERRARGCYAYLTFGRDRDAATGEWDELRKPATGALPSVRDTWGTREAQYILQDLGHYSGNIDEVAGPATQAAIQAFQTDHGLPATGALDNATWRKMVEAYMEQDSLALPEARFLRNANPAGPCDGGIVKWLGAGEQAPVKNTQDAWRPNRRTELLFVKTDHFPCQVPQPVTFDLPAAGAGGTTWCLGPGNVHQRYCFATRDPQQQDKWLVTPAEPGKVRAQGTITFEDGTPVANARYTLLAPDGQYLHTDPAGKADLGERPSGPQRGRPIANRAGADGSFAYPDETPEGVYILEILGLAAPQVARATDESPDDAIGNVVCFRIAAPPAAATPAAVRDGAVAAPGPAAPAGKGGVVQSAPVPPTPVDPQLSVRTPAVVVKRSYTRPARVPITLRTSHRFRRNGTLTRSGNTAAIRLFDAPTGGHELQFDGHDNVFSGGRLSPTGGGPNPTGGVQLFAESDTPSGTAGDYVLTLTLDPGSTPVGPAATLALTAVRLTLDLFASAASPATPPVALPQPPDPAPAPGTATDKWFGGRTVSVQDAGGTQERAKLLVPQVEPFDFTGQLVLRELRVTGNTFGNPVTRLQLFDNPTRTPGETALTIPLTLAAPAILGRTLFAEGATASGGPRDTGFQLGLDGGEPDGDRVALTIGVGATITIAAALRAVVVKRPNTNPARQLLTLQATSAVNRPVTLTRSGNTGVIKLFDAATGGNEIAFNAANQATIPGNGLASGMQLFAEGVTASTTVDDFHLALDLGAGNPLAGLPATAKLTAVALTLDVALSRTAPGVTPTLMTAADKVATGRFVQVADLNFSHERAMLVVQPPAPPGFACTLVVRALDARVQLSAFEIPAEGQAALTLPHSVFSGLTLGGGVSLFAEGVTPSAATRDTGFQLGIDGLENDGDRVPMTAVQLDVAEDNSPATAALTAVRFGLWDQAYDAAGNVRPDFIDNDRRRFHLRIVDPAAAAATPIQVSWKTLKADQTDDDAPAQQQIGLPAVAGSPGRFVSPGVMLVSGDLVKDVTDAAQPTPQARGTNDHRLRLAAIDGFVRARWQPAAGQFHQITVPVFDRTPAFTTTSATNVAAGSQAVTPAAMSGTAPNGQPFAIRVGSTLFIDSGASLEQVRVTAVTATTFTATFAQAHNGAAAPFQIAGRSERRRVSVRVVRYNNPADATYLSATNDNVTDQFEHADRRWRQAGLQIDRQATQDRQIPAGALNAAGRFPFVHPNGAEEQAVLADLLPLTPDNTLTVVFLHLDPADQTNAYAAILPTNPVPLPGGGTATMDDRFFIFINSRLDPNLETLAHELHHVLFNRFDGPADIRFFTFNTNAPAPPLPDTKKYRRIQTVHSANPNEDPSFDNTFNWHRRLRTARFPVAGNVNPAATATTGNRFTGDF